MPSTQIRNGAGARGHTLGGGGGGGGGVGDMPLVWEPTCQQGLQAPSNEDSGYLGIWPYIIECFHKQSQGHKSKISNKTELWSNHKYVIYMPMCVSKLKKSRHDLYL